MTRVLAVVAGLVNTICMYLALLTADVPVLLVAMGGAGFSFYAYLAFTDIQEEDGMGYASLAMRLRWELKEEGIAAGTRLASSRSLAKRYDTTRTTVARALQLLAEEGLVEIVAGRGVFVLAHGNTGQRHDKPKDRIEWHLLDRQAGELLPSTDDLAHMHQVSQATIRRVKADLLKRGLIQRTAKGYERT